MVYESTDWAVDLRNMWEMHQKACRIEQAFQICCHMRNNAGLFADLSFLIQGTNFCLTLPFDCGPLFYLYVAKWSWTTHRE